MILQTYSTIIPKFLNELCKTYGLRIDPTKHQGFVHIHFLLGNLFPQTFCCPLPNDTAIHPPHCMDSFSFFLLVFKNETFYKSLFLSKRVLADK